MDKPDRTRQATFHFCFSAAYAPTRLLLNITDSPYWVLTLLSLGSCFLAGLFVLLLCKELALRPVAGLISGGSVATAPLMMYWLTFPMFPSVACWSAGLLYALTRLARKVDLIGCAVLAFSCYSLLMAAYQQAIIFQAYLFTGYLSWLVYRRGRLMGSASAVHYLCAVAASGVTGIVLALPAYIDLADTAANSSRIMADLSFFLTALPRIDSFMALIRMIALGTFPELTENPVSPSFPFSYEGLSVTPLILFLAFFSLLRCWRETWGWWLAIVLVCASVFIPPLYGFAVRYMGFNLSRATPLGTIILPLTIISAYGVNALAAQFRFRTATVGLAIAGTSACFAVALCFYWTAEVSIRWDAVFATLVVIALLARQVSAFRPAWLIAALAVVGAYVSFPLLLRQPAAALTVTSPVVEKAVASTEPGSRFAMAAPGSRVLPPNANEIFDLASVHSYNSLSSRRYRTLIRGLGGETEVYGRWNAMISPDYDSQTFWMSNIALMISPDPLSHPNLEHIGNEGPLHFYRTVNRMGCCLQTALPDRSDPAGVELGDREGSKINRPTKTGQEGEPLEFEVQERPGSLLVLSQQHHPQWRASVRTPAGWVAARTVPVNGVFQGVVLPAETRTVRLQFFPFVRFAWLAHVFWAIVLVILALRAMSSYLMPVMQARRIHKAARPYSGDE